MKEMKCNQLGGPASCEKVFCADSWDDMKQKSMNHGKEMFALGDEAHLQAGQAMREKMRSPDAMQQWMAEKKKLFDEIDEC